MKWLIKKLGLASTAVISLLALGAIFLPQSAAAAGETYTWKDYRTLTVTGGDSRGSTDLLLAVDQGGPGLVGDQIGILRGRINYKDDCAVNLTIYIFKAPSDPNKGLLWNPPGPIPVPPSVGQPGSLQSCNNKYGNYDIQNGYHNQWVPLGGTRPTNPDAPERPEEQLVNVLLNAPEPFSRTPATATFTLKREGGAVVGSLSAPKKDDSGAADYPPDQTPATYQVQFQKVEPGKYEICVDVPGVECVKFEKKKREAASVTMGKRFEMPHERKITVKVLIPFTRPCGSTYTVSPYTVTLTGPSGQTFTKQTQAGKSTPTPQEAGAICTVNGQLVMNVDFIDGIENGTWRACIPAANICGDVTKEPGKPAEITLRTEPELVAPEADPICSTGTGLAGVTAWILCPLTEFIVRSTEFLERNLIVPFLTVSPLQTGDNAVYKLWESMRNIANILFIIAFFFIIFSQATSIGISNYGIKRLLPRLALVAIGTNLSYFIVAFAIDAFNVFGANIAQLTLQVIQGGSGGGGADSSAAQIFSVTVIAGVGITIAAAITSAGAILGWLFTLIGIAFLILIVAVIVLVLRQIVIILLVIVSPFAFVAWLLPNTERYFTKWRQLLIQLLMMYPLIVLLFAVGKIFQALINAGQYDLTGGGDVAQNTADTIKIFMGFFAACAPLVLLPAAFMASGKFMGAAFNALQGGGRKFAGKAKEKAGERVKPWMDEKRLQMARSNSRTMRALGGARILRREAKRKSRMAEYQRAQAQFLANETIRNPRFARQSAGIGGAEGVGRVVANAEATVAKLDAQELNMALGQLRRSVMSFDGARRVGPNGQVGDKVSTDDALVHLANGGSIVTDDGKTLDGSSALYREAAMHRLADDGRANQIRAIQDHYNSLADQNARAEGQAMATRAIKDNFKSLVGKAPDLVKGPGSAFGDVSGDVMAGFNDGTMRAMAQYMSDQYTRSQDASLSAADRATAQTNYQQTMAKVEDSLKSIAATPALQSKLSGQAGLELLNVANGGVNTVHADVVRELNDVVTNRGITINQAGRVV